MTEPTPVTRALLHILREQKQHREANIINRMCQCIYFQGRVYPCAQGVTPRDHWPFKMAPCHDPAHRLKCPSAEYESRQQAEAEEKRSEIENQQIIAARKLILEAANETARKAHEKGIELEFPLTGRVVCPACGGSIGYSMASNGHVAAGCRKEGCLAWME